MEVSWHCEWYLLSWVHSDSKNCGHSSICFTFHWVRRGRAMPFDIAIQSVSGDILGHSRGSCQVEEPDSIACRWWRMTFNWSKWSTGRPLPDVLCHFGLANVILAYCLPCLQSCRMICGRACVSPDCQW